MNYDQEYINGLGALSRQPNRSSKGKTKPNKKTRKTKRDDDKSEKEVYYKKRDYPFAQVDTIGDSVKFIRRFINLVNVKIEQRRLASFIRALQRAIVQRVIRKGS